MTIFANVCKNSEVKKALAKARKLLRSRSEITGVGYGLKFKKGEIAPDLAMVFRVVQKKGRSELAKKELIPSTIYGIETDVVESGYSSPLVSIYSPTYRVVQSGQSIGPWSYQSATQGAGTFGGVFRDTTTGNLVGLTCQHVQLGYQSSQLDTHLIHPSFSDGGNDLRRNIMGIPLRGFLNADGDAGIFALSRAAGLGTFNQGIVYQGAADPSFMDDVACVCRTTGFAEGYVSALMLVQTDYSEWGLGTIEWEAIEVMPHVTEIIAQGGDSGSLWYRISDQKIMGITTAAPDSGLRAYLTPIVLAMTNLDLEFVPPVEKEREEIGTYLIGTHERKTFSGSFSVPSRPNLCSLRANVVRDQGKSFASFLEWAKDQGYIDDEDFLEANGFEDSDQYIASLGYRTVEEFLAEKEVKAWSSLLTSFGIEYV